MRFSRLSLLLFVFIIASAFGKGKDRRHPFDPARIYSVKELREDFSALRRDIEKRQPNLYVYTPKARMDVVFDSLFATIDHPMDFYEFYYRITAVVYFIRDGHNLIAPGERTGAYNDKHLGYFPLHISCIEGKLYSDMNFSHDTTLKDGSEILSINGRSSALIRDDFHHHMIRDGYNETLPDWVISTYFRGFYGFFTGFRQRFEISYRAQDSLVKTITLPAEPIDTMVKFRLQRYKARMETMGRRTGMRLRLDTASKTAVMRIESFDEDLLKGYHLHFRKVFDRFMDKIDSAKSETLILDLRDNNGGDPALSVYLLRRLMNEPFVYIEKAVQTRRFNPGGTMSRLTKCKVPGFGVGTFTPVKKHFAGKIFVLINGGSFSATGELCSVLDRYDRATFIGEETGGNNVICGGQMFKHRLVLPNTRIVCLTGTEASIIRDPATNTGHGTLPDYFVHNTIGDIVANRDAVMEFAKKLAAGK